MHNGKLSVISVALLLGAAAPSFGQSPKEQPLLPPPLLFHPPAVDLHDCKSKLPEHQDEEVGFFKINPKWRSVVYRTVIKGGQVTYEGCRQMLLELAPNDTFVAVPSTIKPVAGAPSCSGDVIGKPTTVGIHGRMQTFCYKRTAVDGRMHTYRYAMMLIWDDPPLPEKSDRYGVVYSLQGADQNSNWDPKFVGVGVDSYVQYDANIIVLPEPSQ